MSIWWIAGGLVVLFVGWFVYTYRWWWSYYKQDLQYQLCPICMEPMDGEYGSRRCNNSRCEEDGEEWWDDD